MKGTLAMLFIGTVLAFLSGFNGHVVAVLIAGTAIVAYVETQPERGA